jgi:formylglycine-generating enzyme required for sulfatase activity
MAGNVAEWVASSYRRYPFQADRENSSDLTLARVLRGGSWLDGIANTRSASRARMSPGEYTNWIGIRLVFDPFAG